MTMYHHSNEHKIHQWNTSPDANRAEADAQPAYVWQTLPMLCLYQAVSCTVSIHQVPAFSIIGVIWLGINWLMQEF